MTDALLLTVEDFAGEARIGRTKAYAIVGAGEVRSIRVGRAIRIPRSAVLEWIDSKAGNPASAAAAN